MRPDDNLVLTGFMATGKSTVGRMLAEKLDLEFVDTDVLIESRHGPIPRIFARHGEERFRAIERGVAAELGRQTGLVVAAGGRMLLDPENLRSLSRHGRIFCLVAEADEIHRRVDDDPTSRPLLEAGDPRRRIDELMKERERGYKRFPRLATDHVGPEAIADEIARLWRGPSSDDVECPAGTCRFTVGAAILPLVRRIASIDGPMVAVTDDVEANLYVPSLGDVDVAISLPGERGTERAIQAVHRRLVDAGIDESATIVSLGSGTIADVAGFVAATHMGGLDVVHCPTDLIAMLDTGVPGRMHPDLSDGLARIGRPTRPRAIVADVGTLQALPWRELSSGLAEVLGRGLVGSPQLLDSVLSTAWGPGRMHHPRMLADLQSLVSQAIQVQAAIVEADGFEEEPTVLDLGHAFAAGIEHASSGDVNHGEAVAMGLAAAARLSHIQGHAAVDLPEKVAALVSHVGLTPDLPESIDPEVVLDGITHHEQPRHFVLLRAIGDPFITEDVSDAEVLEALRGHSP